jgi:hypothetical protein
MKKFVIGGAAAMLTLFIALTAFAEIKYSKVASLKDIGQNRVFFIALREQVPQDALEDGLWEIVNYHMDQYGQAPQMWIYFFDDKKFTPKDFPIEGEALDHLIAVYFYATDTRVKDLKLLSDLGDMKKSGKIESPLWEGQ